MKSRYSFCCISLSASVTSFLGQRLHALGEIIARELEHSYKGVGNDFGWPAKNSRRFSTSARRSASPHTLQELAHKEKK
jgi:hypothetical protein